jgi:hypothetical protein
MAPYLSSNICQSVHMFAKKWIWKDLDENNYGTKLRGAF